MFVYRYSPCHESGKNARPRGELFDVVIKVDEVNTRFFLVMAKKYYKNTLLHLGAVIYDENFDAT